MKARIGLLAGFAVVFSSAPAFACHRHLFFWHHCREANVVAVAPLPLPLPVPMVVPLPLPVPVPMAVAVAAPAPVYVEEEPMPAPPMVVAEPVVVAPPPPAPVVVAPVPVAPRPVVVVPAPVVVAQPQAAPEDDGFRRLAVKYAPGLTAVVDTEAKEFGPASFLNNIGLEFRISRYFALRGDLELRSGGRSWQVPGLKVSLFPSSRVHPFGSLSLSINQVDGQPANRVSLGVMAAAGLDLSVWRWLFVTAEARYQTVPGNCCALPRVTGLFGVGVQFF